MYYIKAEADTTGNHGNPVSQFSEGMVSLPDELLSAYIQTMGFANISCNTDDVVTSVTLNQEAYDAYIAEHQQEDDEMWRADRDYEPGEYLTVDETLYKVVLPIYAQSRITPGTNVEATTMEAEMANFNSNS